jgi:membrane protease YdiL (CAAX protease family)
MIRRYRAYLDQTASLRPQARLWGIPLMTAAAVLGNIAATAGVFMVVAWAISAVTGEPTQIVLDRLAALGSPAALVAFLFSFAGASLGILLAFPLIHRLRPGELNGVDRRFQWDNVGRAAALVLAVGVASTALALPIQDLTRNAGWSLWLTWALPALAGILVQVHAEELFFRGYLQRMLAARWRQPAIWLGIPAVAFAATHLPNAAAFGANAWLVLLVPFLVGLAAGDVTARTGGIGGAVGLHFANNALGILLVGVPGPFGQIALWQHSIDLADAASVRPMILLNLAVIVVAYGVYRLLEARLHRLGRGIK